MSTTASITIHESQFPENVRRDLLASLRARRVNHKFHYDSVKQTQKWLVLHQAYSPTRNDADCRAAYEKSFKAAAEQIKTRSVHFIGLGCGGGQKDTRLLKLLKARGKAVFYTPCDVSAAMVLTARQTALAVVPEKNCFPFVCDLTTADDLPSIWEGCRVGDPNDFGTATRRPSQNDARILTFFGMIPNFEPEQILPKLAALVRPGDFLLFSANLAPGKDYAAGVKKVLPQYDNPLTRDWLMTFLLDLGVERRDGQLRFNIETCRSRREEALTSPLISVKPRQRLLTLSPMGEEVGLKRIVAGFRFTRARRVEVEDKRFDFRAGETIQLFFSYRYTPERVRRVLARHGLEVCRRWITNSEEEGVFLCQKAGGTSSTSP